MSISDDKHAFFRMRYPSFFQSVRLWSQIRVYEIRWVMLLANVMEQSGIIGYHKRIKWEFNVSLGFSSICYNVKNLCEQISNFRFLFVPSCNVLLDFSTCIMFFVQCSVWRMHKLACERIRIFHVYFQTNIIELDPFLDSVVIKFGAHCLNLLDIGSVD